MGILNQIKNNLKLEMGVHGVLLGWQGAMCVELGCVERWLGADTGGVGGTCS